MSERDMKKIKRNELELSTAELASLIYEAREQKVMLDSDLAQVYGVPTRRLNEQVKRNLERFPSDFMFQLTKEEWDAIRRTREESESANRSQFATGSEKHRDPRYGPYVFTEHGAIMAANVLRSSRAAQMSVFVVRAFVRMRSSLLGTRELARQLASLEKELKERLDVHEAAIVEILQRFVDVLIPPPGPAPRPKRIGFRVKEKKGRYLKGRR